MTNSTVIDSRLEYFARLLSTATKKMLFEKSGSGFSSRPEFDEKAITKFTDVMRIDAMEKFNSATVCSWVSLYLNEEDMKAEKNCLGLVVAYLQRDFVNNMMEILDYPEGDEDDDQYVLECAGVTVNLMAGAFVNELTLQGYPHLQMSHFNSYINSVPDGVKYPTDQTQRFEVTYDIQGKKRLVADLVLASL